MTIWKINYTKKILFNSIIYDQKELYRYKNRKISYYIFL